MIEIPFKVRGSTVHMPSRLANPPNLLVELFLRRNSQIPLMDFAVWDMEGTLLH
jgi:hypothetical protein